MLFSKISFILLLCLILSTPLYAAGSRESRKTTIKLTEEQLERSLVAAGDPARFQRLFAKIRAGEACTLGFIGGSITTGAKSNGHEFSWPKLVFNWFVKSFPDTEFTYANAAVGATGSLFAAHRVQRQLLVKEPDAVFVEFGVNDYGRRTECMPTLEGLLRQILKSPKKPAVAMLFCMIEGGLNTQKEHGRVGNHYGLPMVSYMDACLPEIKAGRIPWEQIMADNVHPNREGHSLCAELVIARLKTMLAEFPKGAPAPSLSELPEPLTGDLYEHTAMYTADDLIATKNEGWTVTDKGRVARFGKGWVAEKPGSVLEFDVIGKVFTLLFYRVKSDMGRIAVQIDGGERKVFDAWFKDTWGGYSARCPMPPCKDAGRHRLRIELLDEKSPESNGHLFQLQAILAAGVSSVACEENSLSAFPDYPPRIKKNYDYSVTVTQGTKTEQLNVYNCVRQKTRMDKYRRFCEFAFSGEPVRVDIAVHYDDIRSYSVMPSSYKIPSSIKANVISVVLDKPKTFLLRINDDYNSIISVFVEDSQKILAEVPDKNDPDVIYYDKGWHDVDGGFLKIDKVKTLYLAPGSVLNARIQTSKSNLTICGQGMVRDPFDDRMKNDHGKTYVVNVASADNVTIKGIKIVDCRFYHVSLGGCSNCLIENVKLLSNQISTDGFRITGPDNTIRNCFAYIGDDVFTGKGTNMKISDCVVGGYGGGIISMDNITTRISIENIDVFRTYGAILRNRWGEKGDRVMDGLTIKNLRAVDCSFVPFFFKGGDQGKGRKEFVLKNVSMRLPAGTTARFSDPAKHDHTSVVIDNGSDYVFDMENFWINGELVTNRNQVLVKHNCSNDPVFNLKGSPESKEFCVVVPNQTVLKTPQKVLKFFLGGFKINLKNQPVLLDGKCYVPIDEISKIFGYSVNKGNGKIVLEKQNQKIEIDGKGKEGSLLFRDNTLFVTSDLIKRTFGTELDWVPEKMILRMANICDGLNILENPGFEESFGQWTASGFAHIFRVDDAFSGEKSLHVIPKKTSYQGVFQEVSDQLNRYGKGKYLLSFYAKAGNLKKRGDQLNAIFKYNDHSNKGKYRNRVFTLTKKWKKYSAEFDLDWKEGPLINAIFTIQACKENTMDFYVDDLQLTKVEQ